MHIAYLDESGTHSEARYFVVAGLSVFERDTYFMASKVNQIQARYFPDVVEPIAFHAADLRAPSGRLQPPFDALTDAQRKGVIDDMYGVLADSRCRIFGIAMEKVCMPQDDPYERGFEEFVNRFDRMLWRIQKEGNDAQRGLIVIAESTYRENLETLARRIWSQGHRWGEIHNMADVPYFAPTKSTRLLQLADFVANAIYGRYENGYTRNFDRLIANMDQEDGRLHGLVHIAADKRACYCPVCAIRRVLPRPDEPVAPIPSAP